MTLYFSLNMCRLHNYGIGRVLYLLPICACHAYMMPNRHWGYTPGFFPHYCVRRREGFFPAGLVQEN